MVALVFLATSCVRQARTLPRQEVSGTCEGACQHYLGCKGEYSEASKQTCVTECREIFVYQGEPDRDSLEEFESLQCEAAVAFVEGDGDAGSRPNSDATRASQAR